MNTHFRRAATRLATVLGLGLWASLASGQTAATTAVVVELPKGLTPVLERQLRAEGVDLLHAYDATTYLVSRPPTGLSLVPTAQLAQRTRQHRARPARTSAPDARVDVDLVLTHTAARGALRQVLAKADFRAHPAQIGRGTSLRGSVTEHALAALLEHPLVLDATDVLADETQPYNFECRIGQAATALNSGIPGAPHLNGAGVVLGIGDGGALSGHPDVGDRVLHSTSTYVSGWRNHPDMVSGIAAGGGVIDPRQRGVACEAELVVEYASGIVYRAPGYHDTHGLTLTNNSYGPSFSCTNSGRYYGSAASIDNQLYDTPELLHVYAVGNSGRSQCGNLPAGFGTVPAGPQVAKNVLAVGNVSFERDRYHNSSAGPTADGRLKPEIVAVGKQVTSNDRQQGYSTGNGTSYSAPVVTGVLALLSERFQQLSPGKLPDGALLKAIACNTADDLGPAGPDYIHGFGMLNAARALRALERADYATARIAQGARHTHSLSVPAGTEQLSVLLYWPDKAGPTSNDRRVLVNDFDLALVTPAGDTLRPWVLDPAAPDALAVRTRDTLNNIEQVTLAAPAAGTYTLVAEATSLPLGTTDLYLTWAAQAPEVTLTCPYGGEVVAPGTDSYIAWTASPAQTGTWRIEQRAVGGAWQTLAATHPTDARYFAWTPQGPPGAYEVRVTNNATGTSGLTHEPIELFGAPQQPTSTEVCDGSLHLTWDAVPHATAYEVYAFDGATMVAQQTVTDTQFVTGIEAEGQELIYAIAATSPSGKTSPRSVAVIDTARLGGPDCAQPLPVDWISVEAREQAGAVEVAWRVGNETNGSHYWLQRGTPAGDTLGWTDVVRVASVQEAQAAYRYTARDEAAPRSGTVYYRVAQVDLDGTTDHSRVVTLDRSVGTVGASASIALTQNPVRDALYLTNDTGAPVTAELYDLAGRKMHRVTLAPGRNVRPWPARLGAGVYVLRAEGPAGSTAIKLLR